MESASSAVESYREARLHAREDGLHIRGGHFTLWEPFYMLWKSSAQSSERIDAVREGICTRGKVADAIWKAIHTPKEPPDLLWKRAHEVGEPADTFGKAADGLWERADTVGKSIVGL